MGFSDVIDKYGFPLVSKEISQKIYEIKNSNSEKLKNKRLFGDTNGNGKMSEKWKYLIGTNFKISDNCCDALKKAPIKLYEKRSGLKPFVGTMAVDSFSRRTSYLKSGCNSFLSRPMSIPIAFWLEQDIWDYIKQEKIKYSPIYDMGYTRTGCMFCMFGVHLEKSPNRFQRMKITHHKLWDYCINHLNLRLPLDTINVKYE
jgi:3'-phosphoadenosine 5'-phosphosulfate sulfotransferase (PAPS reductase)/FAD synthetase